MKRNVVELSALAFLDGLLSALVLAMAAVSIWAAFEDPLSWSRAVGVTLYVSLIAGVFGWVGWTLFVLPMSVIPRTERWLSHRRFGELIWAGLGIVAYAALVTSWAGVGTLAVAWIPASIGALSGFHYRRLGRRRKAAS